MHREFPSIDSDDDVFLGVKINHQKQTFVECVETIGKVVISIIYAPRAGLLDFILKLQPIIIKSTMEAEYRAVALGGNWDCLHLKRSGPSYPECLGPPLCKTYGHHPQNGMIPPVE